MFLLSSVGFFVLSCCLYRHQMVLPAHNTFKMSSRSLLFTRAALFIALTALSLTYLISPAPDTKQLLDSYVPDITWIRDRGTYYFQEITGTVKGVFWAAISALIIAASTVISLFAHMFYVLNIEVLFTTQRRSKSSTAAIRKSLAILFAQMVVPLGLIFVPISVVFLALLFPGIFSFEFLSSMCFVITLHPIGHNILLVSLTPAYRAFILSWLCCKKKSHRPFDILRVASVTKY